MKLLGRQTKGVKIATAVFILAVVVILINGASATSREAANQSTYTNGLISLVAVLIGMGAGVVAVALVITNKLHRRKPESPVDQNVQENPSSNSQINQN